MPIYVYRCTACGQEKEFLQKINDPPLTVCPACQQQTLSKQLTAAGFELKGSGWYVTDFKNSGSPNAEAKPSTDKTTPGSGTTSTAD